MMKFKATFYNGISVPMYHSPLTFPSFPASLVSRHLLVLEKCFSVPLQKMVSKQDEIHR